MSDVAGVIKSIRDIMRQDAGSSGDAQRIEQLAWMFFLKMFDDREYEVELLDPSYRSPIPADLRWRAWAADEQGITGDALSAFVNNDLFPALQALHQTNPSNPRARVIAEVFDGAFNFMKSGTLLRQVVNKVQAIDFNDATDLHKFGDLYEGILRELQSAGDAGEFYTPRAVTEFMVEMIDPKLGETVIDPAAGTGGFLACTIDHLRRKYVTTPDDEAVLQEHVLGVEKKHLPHILCMTNMLLHGIDVPVNIRHDNTLARPLVDWSPSERVDIVVTNPPFGGTEEDGIESNFPSDVRTRETADLFLVLIMHLLKPGGRCAIVLPDNTLFGDGVKRTIKERLLSECRLHTIVRMPPTVFAPYTNIATNLLFFDKGLPTEEVWFYEHELPAGQKAYGKTRRIRVDEFDALRDWWTDRRESEQAWRVSIDDIAERNYNLDIPNPNRPVPDRREPSEALDDYRSSRATLARLVEQITGLLEQAVIDESATAQAFFSNLPRLAGAPGVVETLRSLILDLAIRGRLVEQRGDEAPASSLLDESRAEVAARVAAGEIRRPPVLAPIDDDDKLFSVPATWCWARLGEQAGTGIRGTVSPDGLAGDEWVLDLEDVVSGSGHVLKHVVARERPAGSTKARFAAGDVLYGKLRPYLNKVVVAPAPGCCTTEMIVFTPWRMLLPEYLALYLRAPTFVRWATAVTHGVKMPRLGLKLLQQRPIAMPPLGEQRRIAHRVEELMLLCAQMETTIGAERTLAHEFAESAALSLLSA